MISKQDLTALFKEKGIPAYRVSQIFRALYREKKKDYEEILVLPEDLRNFLKQNVSVFSFTVLKEISSQSGDTVKAFFKLKDEALIESVLMRFKDGRKSVCVSSQVGCGLACRFCATGTMGFKRNLTAEEIADQALYFAPITHVVFMGMGEPFLNYENVMKAVYALNDKDVFGIAARHITISTSGIVPGIKKLTEEKIQVNLAVSLHAPNQQLREQLMPIAKSYKLPELMAAINFYLTKTHRRISYEYVMLKDVNDSEECALQLAKLIRGQLCHVNLIPYNQTYEPSAKPAFCCNTHTLAANGSLLLAVSVPDTASSRVRHSRTKCAYFATKPGFAEGSYLGFKNAGKIRINRFAEILKSFGIPVTVRVSLGQDISAACGQLIAKIAK